MGAGRGHARASATVPRWMRWLRGNGTTGGRRLTGHTAAWRQWRLLRSLRPQRRDPGVDPMPPVLAERGQTRPGLLRRRRARHESDLGDRRAQSVRVRGGEMAV
jgi:hypothetical protein